MTSGNTKRWHKEIAQAFIELLLLFSLFCILLSLPDPYFIRLLLSSSHDQWFFFIFQVKKSESFGDWTPDASSGSSMFASMTPADELTYTLSGLQPTTYYKVEITAKNALGHSHPTTLVFRTADYSDGESLSSIKPSFPPQKLVSLSVWLSLFFKRLQNEWETCFLLLSSPLSCKFWKHE